MRTTPLISTALLTACAGTVQAQSQELAGYFGFEDPRIIVIDDGMGPADAVDLDQDGLMDLIVVNDRKSRIEVYRQRSVPRSEEEIELGDVNELPRTPYYDRVDISVGHAISGFRIHDVDGDGMLDILYAGIPAEIVYVRQSGPMTFETEAKRRVRGLSASQSGFEIADVRGDSDPELLAIVNGQIHVYDMGSSGVTGEPTKLGSGGQLVALFVEDYNGDGLNDLCAVAPDDDAPLRLWLQRPGQGSNARAKDGLLGAELRFEMPGLIEVEPLRLEGRDAASLAIIERASRRIVLSDVTTEVVESLDLAGTGSALVRDVTAEVSAFANADADRSAVTADLDGNGFDDLIVTDSDANSIVLYRQNAKTGFGNGTNFSAFKEPKAVAAGQWDGTGALEVFVLSEEENTVGVSAYDPSTGRLGFPQPVSLATSGATPVAMAIATGASSSARDGLAIVVRDRRDHTLELHALDAEPRTVALEGVNRPPQSMLAGDYNADGFDDLLLFTPNEPLVMVIGGDEPVVLTDETMPQFGLVQAAGPDNTASLDVNGDGVEELIIADENFVRACTFSDDKGWAVVDQITLEDSSAELSSLSTFNKGGRSVIVASDGANQRLIMMAQQDNGAWAVVERLGLTGIQPSSIVAGRFTGDDAMSVLTFAPDAYGIVRLSGTRVALEEFATFRSDEEDRVEHEIEFGDINSDGYMDMIVLDASEQMCQVFTLSAARRLFFATEFKVFESRLFSRGSSRTFEPSAVIIADLTGDGADDLVLEVHDRYIIYPQMK